MQSSALDCNAIKEEGRRKKEDEEGGEGEGERDLDHGLISAVVTAETSLMADLNLFASGQSSIFIASLPNILLCVTPYLKCIYFFLKLDSS